MSILDSIVCALIKLWNLFQEYILQIIIDFIGMLIGLLPSLPIPSEPVEWGEFGKAIGYFLPISSMVQHFVMMLGLMILWYSYEYIMRWIKMIK